MTPKAQLLKRIHKLDFTIMRNFGYWKDTMKIRKVTKWENIFKKHIPN